jgi:hypothetical protein
VLNPIRHLCCIQRHIVATGCEGLVESVCGYHNQRECMGPHCFGGPRQGWLYFTSARKCLAVGSMTMF